jgi:hypothetical protein
MTLKELYWARGEFLKLSVKKPDLTLYASADHLAEALQSIHRQTVYIGNSNLARFENQLLGMKVENIPNGWYVQDADSNQITGGRSAA